VLYRPAGEGLAARKPETDARSNRSVFCAGDWQETWIGYADDFGRLSRRSMCWEHSNGCRNTRSFPGTSRSLCGAVAPLFASMQQLLRKAVRPPKSAVKRATKSTPVEGHCSSCRRVSRSITQSPNAVQKRIAPLNPRGVRGRTSRISGRTGAAELGEKPPPPEGKAW